MKLRSFILPLMAISFSFVNPCDKRPQGNDTPPSTNDTVFEVKIIHPEFSSVPKMYTVDGTLDPSQITIITANGPGQVESISVNDGDTVTQDTPLLTLSDTEIAEMIDLKLSKIKTLDAKVAEIQQRLLNANNEDQPVTADDTLFLDEDKINQPTQKQFGDTTVPPLSPKTLKAMSDVLQAQIELLTKEVIALEKKSDTLSQKSPINGIVAKKVVSVGNTVKEQDPLLEIIQTNPLSVTFNLPDGEASFVDKGSKVKVTSVDAPEETGTGTVYFVSPNIDVTTQQIVIKANISNDKEKMKGGQKVMVQVASRRTDRVIVLPKKVLAYENGKAFVFVAFKNRAQRVPVTTGPAPNENQIQVFGDLRVDDPIIIERPLELQNNSFIKISATDL